MFRRLAGNCSYVAVVCVCVSCTDYESDFLLWVDTKQHVVITSDLDGQKRSVLLTSSHFLRHAMAITVFEVVSAFCRHQ